MTTPTNPRIIRQPNGPYNVVNLNPAKIISGTRECSALGVKYLMGGKCISGQFSAYPPKFRGIDCSGFARWLLYQATAEGLLIPDGSYSQNDWFGEQGFKHYGKPEYLESVGSKDGKVRICFCRSEDGHSYGHVWFVINGMTYESYGGNGPGSRPFDTPVLARIVDDCYVIT